MKGGGPLETLEDIRSFLQCKIPDGAWRSLLQGRLEKTEAMLREGYWIPCLDLPRLIASGLDKDHRDPRLLAMVSAFIYLGADLLDDLHDRDLDPSSRDVSSADITLLAATLLTVFPGLAIAELETDAATKLRLHEAVSRSLLKMAAGQQQDIALTRKEDVSLEGIKQSIEAKSGEELALSSLLAARWAKVSSSQEGLYEDFGRSLGTALQIVSDVHDLMESPLSKDLQRGALSLPVAFCLGKLQGDRRAAFEELLRTAGRDPEKLEFLRSLLVDAGSLDYAALVVEDLCQRSLDLLGSLELTPSVKTYLRDKIRSVSLLHRTSRPRPEASAATLFAV